MTLGWLALDTFFTLFFHTLLCTATTPMTQGVLAETINEQEPCFLRFIIGLQQILLEERNFLYLQRLKTFYFKILRFSKIENLLF